MTGQDSEPQIDDQALDEHLQGRSLLSRRYKEVADETPPEALDRRVLEMARQATRAPRAWRRWTPPLAVAASALIVLSVVTQREIREEAVIAPAPAPAKTLEAAPVDERADSAPRAERPAEVQRKAASPPPVQAPATQAVAPTRPAVRDDRESRAAERSRVVEGARAPVRRSSRDAASSAGSLGAAATSSAAPASVQAVTEAQRFSAGEARAVADEDLQQDPARWLQEIRRLREAGEGADAEAAWARFREAYPDYPAAAPSDSAVKEQER